MSESIEIGGKLHSIDPQRVTVVFNSSPFEIKYRERLMITHEMSIREFQSLKEIGRVAESLFRMIVHDWQGAVTLDVLRKCGHGIQGVMGLVSLSSKLSLIGVPFGWSYPETGLHPRYQGNLADVAILISSSREFLSYCTEVVK